MKKEDVFIKTYNSNINETVKITENSIETIFEFIKDRSAYDYIAINVIK